MAPRRCGVALNGVLHLNYVGCRTEESEEDDDAAQSSGSEAKASQGEAEDNEAQDTHRA